MDNFRVSNMVGGVDISALPVSGTHDKSPSIKFTDEFIEESLNEWNYSLIGRLDFVQLKIEDAEISLKNQWKLQGDVQLIPLGKSFFIIKLENLADKKHIWEGLWIVEEQILKLKEWEAIFLPDKQKSTSAFAWVHFPGLPIEYWKDKILLSIAKTLGRPVKIDETTVNKVMGYYASVLVETDMSVPIPDKVWIESKFGGFYQKIYIPKKPVFCGYCKTVGHTDEICRNVRVYCLSISMNDSFPIS